MANLNLHTLSGIAIPSIFIIMAATSTIYIFALTNNYLSFYPGLGQVATSLSTITFVMQDTSNVATVVATAAVDSPSSYSGFRVELSLNTIFLPSNISNPPLFKTQPLLAPRTTWTPLSPRSTVLINMSIPLDTADTLSMLHYLALNSNNITAHCTLEVDISTFLDAATGNYVNVKVQELPLAVPS